MENNSKIARRIVEAAIPYLKGKTVTDLAVGLSLITCQLSDGAVGLSYVLRYGLPPQCSAFGFAQSVIGRPAEEIARWLVTGQDNVQRSIGCSVLTAASQELNIPDDNDPDKRFGIEFNEGDTVGMIGLIGPVAQMLEKKVKKLIIFDESVSAFGENAKVCKMEQQPLLLPKCNKMIITGSSIINGSIDGLLEMCSNAEEIAMVGSSTPMFREAWKDTKVTRLAGAWWKRECKDEIFKVVSLSGGIAHLKGYIIHKAVSV